MSELPETTFPNGAAVITGATGALGRAMAHELAKLGMDLVLIARQSTLLDDLAHGLAKKHNIHAGMVNADLSKAETIRSLPGRVNDATRKPIHLVIHCAVMDVGKAASSSGSQLELRNVNLNTIAALFEDALPNMIKAGVGQVILVSSNMAIVPGKRRSLYASTKAELESLGRSWRLRCIGSSVGILVVVPGLFDSALSRTGLAKRPKWQSLFLRPRRDVDALAHDIINKGLGRDGLLVMQWQHRVVRAIFAGGDAG